MLVWLGGIIHEQGVVSERCLRTTTRCRDIHVVRYKPRPLAAVDKCVDLACYFLGKHDTTRAIRTCAESPRNQPEPCVALTVNLNNLVPKTNRSGPCGLIEGTDVNSVGDGVCDPGDTQVVSTWSTNFCIFVQTVTYLIGYRTKKQFK